MERVKNERKKLFRHSLTFAQYTFLIFIFFDVDGRRNKNNIKEALSRVGFYVALSLDNSRYTS